MRTLGPQDGPLAFRFKHRDGREDYVPFFGPPDRDGPTTLSGCRQQLKELLDSWRDDPESEEMCFIYDQVLADMDQQLAEYGDLSFARPDEAKPDAPAA